MDSFSNENDALSLNAVNGSAINEVNNTIPLRITIEELMDTSSDGLSKRKNKKSSTGMSPHCLQQNVTIAYLMCRFYSDALNEQSERFNAVLHYLNTIVNSITSQGIHDYSRPLVSALRVILLENGFTLLEIYKETTKNLLRDCIKGFLNNKFNELGVSSKILILLCEIVQDSELYKAYGSGDFCEFLEYLPTLLLKPAINEACLLAMSKLGKQQNWIFLNALKGILYKVVDQLQNIQVVGAFNVFEGKKHIINLFYWLKPQSNINKDDLEKLLNNIESTVTDKRIAGYCRYILTTV